MKVLQFEIQNYKALAGNRTIEPNGGSFFLVGANGQGKTSAGKALIDILTKNFPSRPVTEGEKEGYIEVTFDDRSRLYCRFEDGKKPKIQFITSDGMKASTPRDFFARMAGEGMTFDVDQFMALAPKPRREMLEKITGIDLSDLNAKEASLMEERKDYRARLKEQEARVKPYDKEDVEKELIDINDLAEKVRKAEHTEQKLQHVKDRISSTKELIDKLKAQLKAAEVTLFEEEAMHDELAEKVLDPFELDALKEQLRKADETNTNIREAREAHEEAKKAKSLKQKYEEADQAILDIREEKEKLIQSKPLPAEGLTFDPDGDGLLLHGLPFEDAQIASSAKIIAALQIAASQLGKIRYLHFDAALLDKDNAIRVMEWAEDNDLQLCIERPLWEGGDLRMEVWDRTGEKIKEVAI